jgi:hypothetical protein
MLVTLGYKLALWRKREREREIKRAKFDTNLIFKAPQMLTAFKLVIFQTFLWGATKNEGSTKQS